MGALNAMMSGSGPTVFGIYDSKEKARKSSKDKRKAIGSVYVTAYIMQGGNKKESEF